MLLYSVLALHPQLLSLLFLSPFLLSPSLNCLQHFVKSKSMQCCQTLAALAGFSVRPVLPPLLHSLASFLGAVAVVLVLGIPSDPDVSHSRVTLEIMKRLMTLQLDASSLVFVSATPPALPSSAIRKVTGLCTA